MSDCHVSIRMPAFNVAATFAFASAADAAVVRACVCGRVSGARMPRVDWRSDAVAAPDVRVHLEQVDDGLVVRFAGAVQTPAYAVDQAGFHWDFWKVFTALTLPRILRQGVVALHAATIVFDKRCVLLPGSSGAGKSSISFASLSHGAEIRATELSFVRDGMLAAGNSTLTIDGAAIERFELPRPPDGRDLDGRLVIDLPHQAIPVRLTELVFPRVSTGPLLVRVITPRRARMLLYENAVTQLPVGHLLAHETHPLGVSPSRGELQRIAAQVAIISELHPAIVEGRPDDIATYLLDRPSVGR